MRIVVTGADGFIGRNLRVRLVERGFDDVVSITRESSSTDLAAALASADFVFHLAGANRPPDESEFERVNHGFTQQLCRLMLDSGRAAPIAFASSRQAGLDNPYGRSKRHAEQAVENYGRASGAATYVFRLTNVFGKWARPHYNSAVATFCHLLSRGEPIQIANAAAPLSLVYVDDVVDAFIRLLGAGGGEGEGEGGLIEVQPVYETTVGQLAEVLREFGRSRESLVVPRVGTGYLRALYATYVSYLPVEQFSYEVPRYADQRGEFVEMLKTPDCGQFSYFTAFPGVSRGEHYHHTKTEKFLVIRGSASFGFRHLITDERFVVVTHGGEGRIVESIPGWAHNVVNVGEGELTVMLWANEIFDRQRPDTVARKVDP